MSTPFTRNYNWVNDKNASIAITASRFDLEMDDMTTKLNQKVVIRSTAPASPIADMIWMDSSVSPAQPKIYTGSAWTDLESIKGADIASATTTDIGAATGQSVDVTGTTTITGLGTIRAGTFRIVRFTGALTLTHNATSLILPGAANITTVANDVAGFLSLGSGNWLCVWYSPSSSLAPIAATQAQQETGTSNVVFVPPGRQHFHQSAAKAWMAFNGTGTPAVLATPYNFSSTITDNATGDWTITYTNALSAVTYTAVITGSIVAGASAHGPSQVVKATTTLRFKLRQTDTQALVDCDDINVVIFGDL